MGSRLYAIHPMQLGSVVEFDQFVCFAHVVFWPNSGKICEVRSCDRSTNCFGLQWRVAGFDMALKVHEFQVKT